MKHLGNAEADAHPGAELEGLERETLRLNRRYVVEVVEHFGLCPWADRARREGRVAERVFLQTSADLFEPSLDAMQALAERVEIDVALFMYPSIGLGRLNFEHFARRLRTLDAERYEPGHIPFAIAAFHPDALPVTSTADRLVPFLRRTPDPTLQLVRETALTRVRGADHGTSFYGSKIFPGIFDPGRPPIVQDEDVRERIAKANLATVQELGVEAFEAVFSDILRDHRETRARLENGKAR